DRHSTRVRRPRRPRLGRRLQRSAGRRRGRDRRRVHADLRGPVRDRLRRDSPVRGLVPVDRRLAHPRGADLHRVLPRAAVPQLPACDPDRARSLQRRRRTGRDPALPGADLRGLGHRRSRQHRRRRGRGDHRRRRRDVLDDLRRPPRDVHQVRRVHAGGPLPGAPRGRHGLRRPDALPAQGRRGALPLGVRAQPRQGPGRPRRGVHPLLRRGRREHVPGQPDLRPAHRGHRRGDGPPGRRRCRAGVRGPARPGGRLGDLRWGPVGGSRDQPPGAGDGHHLRPRLPGRAPGQPAARPGRPGRDLRWRVHRSGGRRRCHRCAHRRVPARRVLQRGRAGLGPDRALRGQDPPSRDRGLRRDAGAVHRHRRDLHDDRPDHRRSRHPLLAAVPGRGGRRGGPGRGHRHLLGVRDRAPLVPLRPDAGRRAVRDLHHDHVGLLRPEGLDLSLRTEHRLRADLPGGVLPVRRRRLGAHPRRRPRLRRRRPLPARAVQHHRAVPPRPGGQGGGRSLPRGAAIGRGGRDGARRTSCGVADL
ncbi:MAG: Na(+)-linked D-alanine glycine permease, partial [uncultured Actinomycetospora sp.]